MKKSFKDKRRRTKTFKFPPSVQEDLFSYLKPSQRDFIKPILRVFKKSAQEELSSSIMDYLETGDTNPPADIVLGGMYFYIINKLKPLSCKAEGRGTRVEGCRIQNAKCHSTLGSLLRKLNPFRKLEIGDRR